jgi:hypothetical protein
MEITERLRNDQGIFPVVSETNSIRIGLYTFLYGQYMALGIAFMRGKLAHNPW